MNQLNSKNILIIIPAYNEEGTIGSVIEQIKSLQTFKIIVINDGSRDKTSEVARKQGVEVIDLPFNLGIGGAVQTGLKYARDKGFNTAIQIDADGQHDPQELKKLLGHLNGFDMVIGSRFLKKTNYQSSFLRLFGNKIFSFFIRLTCKKRISDSTSGFRGFGKKAIDFFSDYYPIDFPEPGSIVTFLKNGYKIGEVGLEMKKRQGGASSINTFKAVYFMLSVSIAILLKSVDTKRRAYE